MIEPRAIVFGAFSDKAVEIDDGAFEPDRRRVQRADRGKAAVRAFEAEDIEGARRIPAARHAHLTLVAPQAYEVGVAGRRRQRGLAPACVVDIALNQSHRRLLI